MLRFFRFRDASGKQLTPESRILSRSIVSATDKLATDLSMLPGEKVIHLHRVRLWDGDVRLVEDIYLPFALFEPILEIGEADIGPLLYPVYEAHCGQLVTFIKEEISITNVAPDDATLLGLQPSQPAVVIDRLALNPSRTPIEWRRSRGDAHRFHYVVEGA
jgi:GntR family transcriptional regulator